MEGSGPSASDSHAPLSPARSHTDDFEWEERVSAARLRCEQAWGCAGLLARLTVAPGPRLRRALGLCYPARGLARVSLIVLASPPEIQDEVICHEAAHYVAHVRHGRVRPHGAEWKALMRAVGMPPRVRLALPLGALVVPVRRRSRVEYEHRCPVCRTACVASRRMPSWRCRDCVTMGLEGRLVITGRFERELPL